MTRRLLNLLAVLSLTVCAATVVLWVRSEWVDLPDGLDLGSSSSIVSSDGGVGWNYWSADPPTPPSEFLGFGRYRVGVGNRTLTEWRLPYWFLALTTAALPAAWLVRSLRRRGRDRGFDVASPQRRQEADGR